MFYIKELLIILFFVYVYLRIHVGLLTELGLKLSQIVTLIDKLIKRPDRARYTRDAYKYPSI